METIGRACRVEGHKGLGLFGFWVLGFGALRAFSAFQGLLRALIRVEGFWGALNPKP